MGAAPPSQPKSVCVGDAVLRTSTRGTVPMGQCAGCHGDSALGAIEDSISQCPFLQMTYTAENPHTDGSGSPRARPRFRPPSHSDAHDISPAPTTAGWRENSCPVISKQPLHSSTVAKMSQHICICPEPILGAHAPSPPGRFPIFDSL
jgi:hypothetical protein